MHYSIDFYSESNCFKGLTFRNSLQKISVCILLFFFLVAGAYAQNTLPYKFVNNTTFADDEIYVAVIGIIGGHVWIDASTGDVHQMNASDNTIQGPVINGNMGPGENGLYADCFTKLSDIPDKTIPIPKIAGSRILISFGSPLYLYFFGYSGAPEGYAAPNLANSTDPNQGIRYETIELTYNDNGLWSNTTRVDSYQYPIGLEVWGAGDFYKKTGEVISHQSILDKWENEVPGTFQECFNETDGTILAPSKTSAFQSGGAYADYFKPYVDAIWDKYANQDLMFNSGAAGVWKGRVENEQFVFHNQTNFTGNATAIISRRPNTQEILEGKGVLAEDVQKISGQTLDLVVQAQFCAALNRHAIDLEASAETVQDWSDSSKFFSAEPYNAYVEFWHREDISWGQSSYGFCYDDVFDYSSTIHTPSPTNVVVTIGGFFTEPLSINRQQGINNTKLPICTRVKNGIQYLQNDKSYDLRGRISN